LPSHVGRLNLAEEVEFKQIVMGFKTSVIEMGFEESLFDEAVDELGQQGLKQI